jgi:predicted enzyme related to lactoylglutathione lyase
MTGPAIFIELGVADAERARAFYQGVFGWAMEPGPTGKGFVIDANGVPAGLHPGDPGASPYVFFGVDDLDAALALVRERGGEVVEMDVGSDDEETARRFGRFKLCRDDQGSPFGLYEPPPRPAG